MSAASILRAVRGATGLSQRALAALAGVQQPRIADIESGSHDTTISRLEQLLSRLDYQLSPLPTQTRPVWEAAEAVRTALQADDQAAAWRQIVQLADDLAREPGATRVALTVTPPSPTGSARFDALIAGVTEYRLRDLPRPDWLGGPQYSLTEPWDVEPLPQLREKARRATPAEFIRHGVYLHARELESV